MNVHPRLRPVAIVLGIIPGLLGIIGGFALIWGSQDAMIVLIHWIGEERALGVGNVIVQPDGGKLLTNPGAMVRWMFLIWAVGASHVMTGGVFVWTIATRVYRRWPAGEGPAAPGRL